MNFEKQSEINENNLDFETLIWCQSQTVEKKYAFDSLTK